MPKTKISEFSATPANNTDIDSINIAEGCAPSGINDAIRELMSQLKDFQTGAVGDSFNGPIGTTTAAAGAFTTLSASSTLAVTGVATLTAQPILSSLTASRAVFTDASKGLVSNAITGTGNVVMSTSPTLVTPTLGVATATSLQGIIGNVTPAAGTFTTVTGSNDASINGLTVGRGAGGGAANTAFGVNALALVGNSGDVAIGNNAGAAKTTTSDTAQSTFVGYYAGASVNTGTDNTFIGGVAGRNTTTGTNNVSVGGYSFYTNISGSYNVSIGKDSLRLNTASGSTAVGYGAAYTNTSGQITAIGYQAGYSNLSGIQSTFVGYQAGLNTTGSANTFIGGGTNSAAGYSVTTGAKNTIIGGYSGNMDGLDIRTASNYAVISDGDGNRQITMKEGQTLALDSAVPNAGTGITFPATQSASSDANTLDDYEEGTWTPALTIGGSSTGITYAYQAGKYTKIGNLVTVQMYLELSSKGSNTGNAQITGLPFTILSTSAGFGGSGNGSCFWGSLNVSAYSSNVLGIPSSTTANIYLQTAAVAATGTGIATNATLANGSYFSFTLTYQV